LSPSILPDGGVSRQARPWSPGAGVGRRGDAWEAHAAYACECRGECGSVHPQGRCAVPHLARVVRDPAAPARWRVVEIPARGTIRIVLAVAHLCQESTCAQLTCLRGLCQRCHLRYHHAQQWCTRRRNQRAALEAAGQQCLGLVEGLRGAPSTGGAPPRPSARPPAMPPAPPACGNRPQGVGWCHVAQGG
jgi:hypothetical protein